LGTDATSAGSAEVRAIGRPAARRAPCYKPSAGAALASRPSS